MRVLHPSAIAGFRYPRQRSSSRESYPALLVMNMQMVASVTVTALITINRLLCQLCPGTRALHRRRERDFIASLTGLVDFLPLSLYTWLFFFLSASILTACRNNYKRNDWNNITIKVVQFGLALSIKQFKKIYALYLE